MIPSTTYATTPRVFVSAELREGAEIAATPEQAHYLGTVLRRAAGEPVRLFNGVDGEFLARIAYSRPRQPAHGATFSVERRLRTQMAESGPWLVFALLKRDATDLVVRQAVELGVSRILPVITERTNAARVNEQRLRAIAIEAAEQSERLTVPPIDPPARLDAVLAAWPAGQPLFAALERSWTKATLTQPTTDRAAAGLLVGPEGGFSDAEQALLRRHPSVTTISLGPTVLRAETAAVAGLALLLAMGWAEYPASN